MKGIDELPAIIDFKKEGVMPTRLVIFAVNFYTNERIVTEKDHSYYINSKVRGFCTALRAVIHETTGNGSTFAAIICEDAKGIQKVISMIQSIDEPLMKHCIFTTGTVLKGAVADCWSNRFLFPGSIRREEVDCLAADLGRKLNGKNNEGHGTGAGSFRSGRLASAA